MSQCPVCHQQIEILDQHHGTLMTCSNCKAVFFVGWDGQPEAAQEQAPVSESPVAETVDPVSPQNYEAQAPEQTPQAFDSQPTPATFDSSPEVPLDGIGGGAGSPLDSSWGTANPAETELTSLEVPTAPQKSSLFADVVDFGNSLQDQGLLSYDILIEGVELESHRQDLKDCLTDIRFRWEVDELMEQIQDGKLSLRKLSAAKMIVLTRRLKSHPFKISWRQSALTV